MKKLKRIVRKMEGLRNVNEHDEERWQAGEMETGNVGRDEEKLI